MSKPTSIFGTDGVRSLAGVYPLDDTGITAIARATGTEFASPDEKIIIGCDTRESSMHIVETIAKGLRSVGVHAVFTGIIPTPGLAFLTASHDEFVAGIMVTASHNPYEFNGIKVFTADGGKLPDETEETLTAMVFDGVSDRDGGSFETTNLTDEYADFLVSTAKELNLSGMKIALDTANGAASLVGARVFERLGAEVIALSNSPDGRNINDHCGATDTDNLKQVVLNQKCDIGIAVDGDADRLIMIDHLGRECNGDHLLHILAVSGEHKRIVATVMTNLGAEQSLKSHDIDLERASVGDRYVLERLNETGLTLGGEQSGHIIMTNLSTTGDGLLSAIQVLKSIRQSDKSLADWRDEVILLPQVLVNFPIEDKSRLSNQSVIRYLEQETAEIGDDGRILVRPSGTEPLARVMVEGENAEELANKIAVRLKELVA